MTVFDALSAMVSIAVAIPIVYLYLLAVASLRRSRTEPSASPSRRFAIAIPAHNEESVIDRTIKALRDMDYPAELVDVFVVADHCSDRTASLAREAGATVFERDDGLRGSKGAALRYLFKRALGDSRHDAVVIFDADTRVEPGFLRIMDARLAQGDQVIQGQHVIRNPQDGWFPALTWAMFLVDNRFQNQSRSNLGWSAKNMGDSICFRADVLRRLGWGEGLTEDYAFRQRLLLEGINISYEPGAKGYGEAPQTWKVARAQRSRWLRGTRDASQKFSRELLREAVNRQSTALLDGAIQAYLPSYSTLTLVSLLAFIVHALLWSFGLLSFPVAWLVILFLLLVYPLLGLALERAPALAYLAILSGPLFIVWRSAIALQSRFGKRTVEWIRTPRREP